MFLQIGIKSPAWRVRVENNAKCKFNTYLRQMQVICVKIAMLSPPSHFFPPGDTETLPG
jgi:hypothetical protein